MNRTLSSTAQTQAAVFSPDDRHRLLLFRDLGTGKGVVNFILCNPSWGGGERNDGTASKCEAYARLWGYRYLVTTNAFTLVGRDFADVVADQAPNLPENDALILYTASRADLIVCGWSDHVQHLQRHEELVWLLQGLPLKALRINASGCPAHPIYLSLGIQPQEWAPKL